MIKNISLSLLIVFSLNLNSILTQFIGSSSSSSNQNHNQYPRIKIGGPLGQLIPNGIQLGSGLGSLMNQLIGQAEQQQQQQQQQQQIQQQPQQQHSHSQSAPVSPYAALRSPFGALTSSQSSMSSIPSFSSPLGSYSPQKGFSFNSQLIPQNFYSDSGLYGSASSPIGLSSGPFVGHSSQLGSTNSELFQTLNSQLFD